MSYTDQDFETTAASHTPRPLTPLETELLALVKRFQDCGGEDADGEHRDFWDDWDDCCIAADALRDRIGNGQ